MSKRIRPAIVLALALAAGLGGAGTALASDYPSRPVTIVVGTSAGGPTDAMARSLAQRLQTTLRQNVVVQNSDGAAGMIANGIVARSQPDGHTLGMGTTSLSVLAPMLSGDSRLDAGRLAPVALVGATPMVLFVSASVPASNAAELVSLMKKAPGKYAYASTGIGSTSNVSGELFKMHGEVDVLHIPYKGGAQLNQSVVTGETQMGINTLGAVLPLHRAGRVKILMVLGERRSALAPELPTSAEAGLPGVVAMLNFYLMAPSDVPEAVAARLNAAVAEFSSTPTFAQEMRNAQIEVYPHQSVAQSRAAFAAERQKWADVIARAGIKVQ